jgi:hypothetical protein
MDPVTGGAIGGGMQMVGGMIEGKKNRAAEKARYGQQRADIGIAQGRSDDYTRSLDAYKTGASPELLAMARAPQTSDTTSYSNTSGSSSRTPEAQAADAALQGQVRGGHEDLLGRSELPAGYLEGIAQGGAKQIRDLQGGLQARAAMAGGQSSQQSALDALLAGSGITAGVKSQISQAPMMAEQIKMQRLQGAQRFLDPRLAMKEKFKQQQRGGSSTSSSPSVAGMLAAHQFGAPSKPDIILPV